MTQKGVLWLTVPIMLFHWMAETEQCKDGVCFTWSVTLTQLKLVCKVGELGHRILITDPSGNPQADCLPPVRPHVREKCDSYYKNGSVWQNVRTNQTFYTVHGQIDDRLNGNWTCSHGTGLGIANVEVSVLKIKELSNASKTPKKKEEKRCPEETWIVSMLCFVSIMIVTRIAIFLGYKNKGIRELLTKVYHSGRRGRKAAVFLVIAVVCFALMIIVSFLERNTCISKWVLSVWTFGFSCYLNMCILRGPEDASTAFVFGIEMKCLSVMATPKTISAELKLKQLQQEHDQLQQEHDQLQDEHHQLQQEHNQLQLQRLQPQPDDGIQGNATDPL